MPGLNDWDAVAANNNDSPPDGAPEGMAFSAVNNVMREMMAVRKRHYEDTNGSKQSAGDSVNLTLTLSEPYAAYFNGMTVKFSAGTTNTTTAPTMNVNSLGAIPIKDANAGTVIVGAIQTGGVYTLTYRDGEFLLSNVRYPDETQVGYQATDILTADVDLPTFSPFDIFDMPDVVPNKLYHIQAQLHLEVNVGGLRYYVWSTGTDVYFQKTSLAYYPSDQNPESVDPANFASITQQFANVNYDANKIARIAFVDATLAYPTASPPRLLAAQVTTDPTPSVIKKGSWMRMTLLGDAPP